MGMLKSLPWGTTIVLAVVLLDGCAARSALTTPDAWADVTPAAVTHFTYPLPDQLGLSYSWNVQEQDFIYRATKGQERVALFSANLVSPFAIQVISGGKTEKAYQPVPKIDRDCATFLLVGTSAPQVTLQQRNCYWTSPKNPHLRPSARGMPVPTEQEQPLVLFPSQSGPTIQAFAAPSGELVVLIQNQNPESLVEVRIQVGMALEVSFAQAEKIVQSSTFFRDNYAWWYIDRPASPTEGEPLWSLWSLNKLIVEDNGAVRYVELPANRD